MDIASPGFVPETCLTAEFLLSIPFREKHVKREGVTLSE